MKKASRFIIPWFAASLVCVIIASIISTQRVINGLNDVGGSIGFDERLSMSLYDLMHFGTLYGLFILIAFLIADLVETELKMPTPYS